MSVHQAHSENITQPCDCSPLVNRPLSFLFINVGQIPVPSVWQAVCWYRQRNAFYCK